MNRTRAGMHTFLMGTLVLVGTTLYAAPQPPTAAGRPSFITAGQLIINWTDSANPVGTTYRVTVRDIDTNATGNDAAHLALPTKTSVGLTQFSLPLPSPNGQNSSQSRLHIEVRALYQGELSAPLIISPDPTVTGLRDDNYPRPTITFGAITSNSITISFTSPAGSAGQARNYVWFRDLFAPITGATRQTLVQIMSQAQAAATTQSYTLSNLRPASTYLIEPIWFNGIAETHWTGDFSLVSVTAPADPIPSTDPARPSLIASSTSITVNWIDTENPTFAVTPRAQFCTASNVCQTYVGTVKKSNGSQSLVIPNLAANTNYTIKLVYLNNNDFEYAPANRRPNSNEISFGNITTLPPGQSGPLVPSSLVVTPFKVTLGVGAQQAFRASVLDQHGNEMPALTNFSWSHLAFNNNQLSATSGQNITVTAGNTQGTDILTATLGNLSGSAEITMNPANNGGSLRIVQQAVADPNPTYGSPAHSQVSVLAEATPSGPITYAWSGGLVSGGSAGAVQFDNPNTRISNATFSAGPGLYWVHVIATGPGGLQAQSDVIVDVRSGSAPPPPPPAAPRRRLIISPRTGTIHPGETLPFTAVSENVGSGVRVSTQPVWSAGAGGAMSTNGVLTALATERTITITATLEGHEPDSVTVNVVAAGGSSNLTDAHPYPVPYKITSGKPGVTFVRLAPDTKIFIYSTDGRLVKKLYSNLGEEVLWTLINEDNQRIASGVYLYVLDNPTTHEKKKGKLVIIK